MRRVLLGGIVGALPGLFIALIPLVLISLNVITSDESQIGFIGVPLVFIGVLVGTWIGALGLTHPGKVMFGVGTGFVVGLAGGIAITRATSVDLVWLIVTPAAMIAGGVLAARRDQHTNPPQLPAAQH